MAANPSVISIDTAFEAIAASTAFARDSVPGNRLQFLRMRLYVCSALLVSAIAFEARAELIVEGVGDELERNVRAYASIATEACDAAAPTLRRRYRKLAEEARESMEPFGYYEPAIETVLELGETCWTATVTIDPGDPVLIRDVDVRIDGEAESDPEFGRLAASPSLAPESPLRHEAYENLKESLQIRAADQGYFDAAFVTRQLDVYPDAGHADITLHLDSGPRYRLGEIRQDQDFLDERIVAAYVDLEPGTPFDREDLAQAQQILSESGYFGRVDVAADVDDRSGGTVPIRIAVEPGYRIEYTAGLGASTDTGTRFKAGFRNNRLNRGGHRLIGELEVGRVVRGIGAEYRIPLEDPRREWFSVTGALYKETTDTFDTEGQGLGVRWTTGAGETWVRTLSLDISNESFTIGEITDTTRLVIPGIGFDHKRADRNVFPRSGRRASFEFTGTDGALGSTTSYLQTVARLRWISSLGDNSRLLARADIGYTEVGEFAELPPSVRFFAGGDQSIRGYDLDTLGPTDVDGNVIGGTSLLVASIEYERRLRGNFHGAVFVDAGNAFNDTDLDVEVGAGLGIIWRSPVGPIRLYAGYPVSADDGSVRLHLQLGADL